ncbi:hypothetical protein K439DRAFT_1613258 [Ramaria rubella]|nr:hypothetical protein K439DRAFT_1613258 [Ramaria rubella]
MDMLHRDTSTWGKFASKPMLHNAMVRSHNDHDAVTHDDSLPTAPAAPIEAVGQLPPASDSHNGGPAPVFGYNDNHHLYGQYKAELGARAYRNVEENVTIMASLMYEMEGHTKSSLVGNIRKGISRIPTRIASVALKQLVYDWLHPQFLMQSSGFKLGMSDLRFCKVHTWEDLELTEADVLYDHFLRPGKKPGEKVFKPNIKGEVALVLPSALWMGYQSHLADIEEEVRILSQS